MTCHLFAWSAGVDPRLHKDQKKHAAVSIRDLWEVNLTYRTAAKKIATLKTKRSSWKTDVDHLRLKPRTQISTDAWLENRAALDHNVFMLLNE